MTPKIRTAVFWCGLLLYAVGFALPALVEFTGVRFGFECAMFSVLVVPAAIAGLLPGSRLGVPDFLESASILIVALINPFFFIYAIASPFRPDDRTVRICRILIPPMIPFCWVIFHHEDFHPREGHFLWILGMLLVLASGYSVHLPRPDRQPVCL